MAALVLLAIGLTTRDGEQQTRIAQEGGAVCSDAGDIPSADAQQVADDAESLGCVHEPTTSTTNPDLTTTSTSTKAPTVTVPKAELEAQKGGLRVVATINPLDLKTSELLSVSIRATDSDGGELAAGISWGEPGTVGGAPLPPILECPEDAGAASPSEKEWNLRHSYRTPGKYKIVITVASGYCGDAEGKTLSLDGAVAIGKGLVLSNGPLIPLLDAGRSSEGSATEFNLGIDALDSDGFIRRLVVNWGDGTTPSVFEYPLSECRDPLTSFPGPSRQARLEAHRYAGPGSYEITVTLTSVGCSDGDPQTVEVRTTASV